VTAVNLKSSKVSLPQENSGSYYLFMVNCGKDALKGLKVSGTVKAKSTHGYADPVMFHQKGMSFFFGLGYLVLAVGYGLYVCSFKTAAGFDGVPEKLLLVGILFTSALRLLVAHPVALDMWNTTGYEFSGLWIQDIFVGITVCLFITLYEFMCSQYHITKMNSISTGVDSNDIVVGGDSGQGMGMKERLICGFYNLLILVAFLFSQSNLDEVALMRPPAKFFEEAADSTKIPSQNTTAPGASPTSSGITDFLTGMTMPDMIRVGTLLVTLLLTLVYAERKEDVNTNEFSHKILSPLRSKALLLAVFIMLAQMGMSFFEDFRFRAHMDVVGGFILEAALAMICVLIGYYLNIWDGAMSSNQAYSIVSEKDIEFARMDGNNEDIDEAVEAYDPDQLADKRRLE